MRGLLVRVGIDQSIESGYWNAPINTDTNRFMFVPICDRYNNSGYLENGRRVYKDEIPAALKEFQKECGIANSRCFDLPDRLSDQPMHLDPDFKNLTYGDDQKRGSRLAGFSEGDFIAFYAALKPIDGKKKQDLVYALIGLFMLEGSPLKASAVPHKKRLLNAHTRWNESKDGDIVVFAKPGCSGLFSQCLPIGEPRGIGNVYRVKTELLDSWGGEKMKDGCLQKGIDIRDGYLQRSGYLPEFLEPEQFKSWLDVQLKANGISLHQAQYQVPNSNPHRL